MTMAKAERTDGRLENAATAGIEKDIERRLRTRGQRFTAQRRALVEMLRRARQPLSIRQILGRRTNLVQSSAYRNLVVLEDAGVVRRLVGASGSARYELAEDLTEHHHHLICVSCGSVEDLPASTTLERTVRTATAGSASRKGFKVRSHRVDLLGLCRDCG
jgi:Fur family ferric uptake transcriptional regulator